MILYSTALVHAQGAGIEWDTLNTEAMTLYRQDNYARAVVAAQQALEVAQENVGHAHPDVALSLNNLAFLSFTQGDYAKAGPLYKRSLAIIEKVLGPDHPKVATSLENMAGMYREMERDGEAAVLEGRAARIRAIKR